jgi:hypothetical protein
VREGLVLILVLLPVLLLVLLLVLLPAAPCIREGL